MNFLEEYMKRLMGIFTFDRDALIRDLTEHPRPICHIRQGYFDYKNLNMCFVNDMLARINEAFYQGYLPVVEVSGGEGVDNLWSAFFLQPADALGVAISSDRDSTGDIVDMEPVWGPGYKAPLIPREAECACTLYRNWFILNEKSRAYVDDEYERLIQGKKVLGVLARGTDLGEQKPKDHPVQPSLEELMADTQMLVREGGYDAVYLATEEKRIEDIFQKEFPGQILVNRRHYLDVMYDDGQKKGDLRMPDGYVYLKDLMEQSRIDFYTYGMEYLSSIVLLSRCSGLLAGNTGGSDAAMYLNDHRYETLKIYDLGFYE